MTQAAEKPGGKKAKPILPRLSLLVGSRSGLSKQSVAIEKQRLITP